MKKFLLVSSVFLVVALFFVVAVFIYLHSLDNGSSKPEIDTSTSSPQSIKEENQDAVNVTEPIAVPEENLTAGQKRALETVGVDTANITITPAMIDCATEIIGAERVEEIRLGDSPTLVESGRLLPCLGAE